MNNSQDIPVLTHDTGIISDKATKNILAVIIDDNKEHHKIYDSWMKLNDVNVETQPFLLGGTKGAIIGAKIFLFDDNHHDITFCISLEDTFMKIMKRNYVVGIIDRPNNSNDKPLFIFKIDMIEEGLEEILFKRKELFGY